MIEQIIIEKTLKAGKNVWEEGTILNSPLPEEILDEVRAGTNTVKVLKSNNDVDSEKIVLFAPKVKDPEFPVTNVTTQGKTKTGHAAVSSPEAQLKQPQRSRKPDLEPYIKPKPVLRRRKKK